MKLLNFSLRRCCDLLFRIEKLVGFAIASLASIRLGRLEKIAFFSKLLFDSTAGTEGMFESKICLEILCYLVIVDLNQKTEEKVEKMII